MAIDLKKFGIELNTSELTMLEQLLNKQGSKEGVSELLDAVRNRSSSIDPIKVDDVENIMVHKGKPITIQQAVIEIERLNAAGISAIEDDLRQVQLPYWERTYGQLLGSKEGVVFSKYDTITKLLNLRSGKVKSTGLKESESANIIKNSTHHIVASRVTRDPNTHKEEIFKEEFTTLNLADNLSGYHTAGGGLFSILYVHNEIEYLLYGKVSKSGRDYQTVYKWPPIVGITKVTDKVEYDPTVPEFKDLGHIIADKTRPLLTEAAAVKAIIHKLRDPTGRPAKMDPPTASAWLDMLGKLEASLDRSLVRSIQHDLIFIHANTLGKGRDVLTEYDKIMAAAQATGVPQVRIIGSWGGNSSSVSSKEVHSELDWTIYTADPSEPAGINRWRGDLPGSSPSMQDRGTKDLNNVLRSNLQLIVQKLVGIMNDPSSSSMLTEASLKALAKILMPIIGVSEAKKILASIKTRSKKVILDKTVTLKQPKKKRVTIIDQAQKVLKAERDQYAKEVRILHQKFRKAEAARLERLRAKNKIIQRGGKPELDYNNIVSKINSQLREAVIAQMGPHSLMNRTGRFAGSVKVTRASEKSLNFIYEKNPYGVFRTVGGDERVNHPRTRDPGKIIRAAIRSISQDNMSEYFRDKLYIRED